MAWITSTIAKRNIEYINPTDDQVTVAIALATDIITVEINNLILSTTVATWTDSTTTPDSIQLLCEYKTKELLLYQLHQHLRQNADIIADIEYWRKMYLDLLEKILSGVVKVVDEPIAHVMIVPPYTEDFANIYSDMEYDDVVTED